MDNMKLYKLVEEVPADYLKRIEGGRLNKFTDINPQWRIMAMTNQFGPCGIGWWFTVDKKWIEEGAVGEKMAFADITLYYKLDGVVSQGIPGSGGSGLIKTERGQKVSNDEAYKMATTDALGTAMKFLGIGGKVYAGCWDGSKYISKDDGFSEQPPATAPAAKPATTPSVTAPNTQNAAPAPAANPAPASARENYQKHFIKALAPIKDKAKLGLMVTQMFSKKITELSIDEMKTVLRKLIEVGGLPKDTEV